MKEEWFGKTRPNEVKTRVGSCKVKHYTIFSCFYLIMNFCYSKILNSLKIIWQIWPIWLAEPKCDFFNIFSQPNLSQPNFSQPNFWCWKYLRRKVNSLKIGTDERRNLFALWCTLFAHNGHFGVIFLILILDKYLSEHKITNNVCSSSVEII